MKNVLSGLFLMIENQIRVNDVAVINGRRGLVEEINLRTTVLRSDDCYRNSAKGSQHS
jgi:moderate conductance mechanosensitive channel